MSVDGHTCTICDSTVFPSNDAETLPTLFRTLDTPHLEYCNTSWRPFNRADQRVEQVQRKANIIVPAVKNLPCVERLRVLVLPSQLQEATRAWYDRSIPAATPTQMRRSGSELFVTKAASCPPALPEVTPGN